MSVVCVERDGRKAFVNRRAEAKSRLRRTKRTSSKTPNSRLLNLSNRGKLPFLRDEVDPHNHTPPQHRATRPHTRDRYFPNAIVATGPDTPLIIPHLATRAYHCSMYHLLNP